MDPNQTLKEIRALCARMVNLNTTGDPDDALQLAEKVNDMDTWLSQGNFPPDDWDTCE